MSLPPFLEEDKPIQKQVVIITPESVEETKEEYCERLLEGIEEKNIKKMCDALDGFFKVSEAKEEKKDEEKPSKLPAFLSGGKL